VRTILNRAARSYRDDDGRWRPRKTKELIALALGVAGLSPRLPGFHLQKLIMPGVTPVKGSSGALGVAVYMGGCGPSLMYAATR